MFTRTLIAGTCAALVLGGVIGGIASPAAAAACDPGNQNTRADFDGDGYADVAVGMPWRGDGYGAVDLRGTGSDPVVLTSGMLGAGTGEGDGFGAEIAIADLDGDGCADLVIGAPAEGQSDASDGAGNNEGQVHIVFGGPGGVTTSGSITLPHDSENLDHFGSALALVQRYDGTRTVFDLYVGARDASVGGHASAGEVFRYSITPTTGTARVTAALREVRSQDSAGVPGASETGDGFGSYLAAIGGGVLVGAPNEDIGSAKDAGAVWFLRTSEAGAPIASQNWSQNTAGVPGTAEAGDHFGAALAGEGSSVVVGVPDENQGSLVDSGMVQTFNRTSSGLYSPGKLITQDTAGIPGAVEAGDRFGAAVVVGVNLLCQEAVDTAVGAPGEDIGTRADAGSVTLVTVGEPLGCPAAKALRQGAGLAGAAEAGDEVGSVLGLTRRDSGLDEDYSDRLLIGVPSEDIGASTDSGMVQPARGSISADGVTYAALQFSGGYLNADHYGMVLTTPSN